MKNILVVSHERSGTHFLINSIAFNFAGRSNMEVSIDTGDQDYARDGLLTSPSIDRVFKSHHTFEFFQPFIDELKEKFHIFYIVRDGRDVLTSCYYHYQKWIDEFDFETFLHTCLMPDHIGRNYWNGAPNNMAEKWANHVDPWLDSGVDVIRFEKLKDNFEGSVLTIASVLGQQVEKFKAFKKPTLKDRVVDPRMGVSGDWQAHFSNDDLEFFNQFAEKTMRRLGYYD